MHQRLLCFALLLIAAGPRGAPAEESVPARARAVFERNRNATVKVTGVTQIRLSAAAQPGLNPPEQESKFRADGTVIDPSGLTVVSLSTIDSSRLIDGREANSPAGPVKVEATGTIKELEIILGDGTEIPATMIFKDTDLDLAFIRPKADAPEAKDAVFEPVDLAAAGTAEVADYTVSVARLEELFNYAPAMLPGQVTAVIDRPRLLYLSGNVVRGCPMFTLDGKLLGIGTVRHRQTEGGTNMGSVLVPAVEVRKLRDQIPAPDARESEPPADPAAARSSEAASS